MMLYLKTIEIMGFSLSTWGKSESSEEDII